MSWTCECRKIVLTGNTCKKCGRMISEPDMIGKGTKEPVYITSKSFQIEWEGPAEEHLLSADKIRQAMLSCFPITNCKVKELFLAKQPEEKKVVNLKRFIFTTEVELETGIMHKYIFVNGRSLMIEDVISRTSFRGGYFELNDGTKSKIPYIFKRKHNGELCFCLNDTCHIENWESLYPVAVWLEE